jgi:hypothetical protein
VTVEDVQGRLEMIRRSVDDDERAHALEVTLHQDVIRYFAATGNPVAIEALKSLEIEFHRWFA